MIGEKASDMIKAEWLRRKTDEELLRNSNAIDVDREEM